MDWTVKDYDEANHPPVPALACAAEMTTATGDTIRLSAAGTSDPDGDRPFVQLVLLSRAGEHSTWLRRARAVR